MTCTRCGDRSGLWTVVSRILGNPNFFLGVTAMAVAFFSLLFALSWGDVSLVAPAAASLTFIGNAFAAKIFLHERVDRRRWIAALLVGGGRRAAGGVRRLSRRTLVLPLLWSLQCSLGHSKNVVGKCHEPGPWWGQSRSTRAGSVRVARQAGSRQAATEAIVITTTANANASGSFGLTS